MRRLVLVGSLAAILAAAIAVPAPAHPGKGSPLEKAGQRVDGVSPGEWLGRWWEVALETPAADQEDPFCTRLGRDTIAPIFPLEGGTLSCTVPEGTRVVVVTITTECSDVEPDPFFGRTPRERRDCAIANNAGVQLNEVTVDGDYFRLGDRYRALSPDLVARLPADNILGVPAGRARYRAEGWVAVTKPLRRGRHRIEQRAVAVFDGETLDLRGVLDLTVVRRGHR